MRLILLLCLIIVAPSLARAGDASAGDTTAVRVMTDAERKAEIDAFGEKLVPGEKQWQRQKSAKVAVYSDMVLPGLGQVYNGRRLKALTVVGLMTYYAGRAWVAKKQEVRRTIQRDQYDVGSSKWLFEDRWVTYYRATKKDHIWWSGAVYLISMLDAFVDAHLYDVRAVDPSVIRGMDNQHYIGLSYQF